MVKIRPLWDGNLSILFFMFLIVELLKSDHCGMETLYHVLLFLLYNQLKSDHCGMETLKSLIDLKKEVIVKIRPLWDGNKKN